MILLVKDNPSNVGLRDYFYRRFYRNNETGRISDKIYDLIDISELTINRKYVFHHYHFERRHGSSGNSLFEEISIVPYEEVLPPYWLELMRTKPKTRTLDLDDFIAFFKEEMMSFIDRNWDSDKFHFVLHSSGWDSRVLSYFLREIYENRGKEDFGDFVFVCWGEETPVFEKIMKLKGWKKSNYISLPQFDDAYYDYLFDFKTAYKRLNGPTSYPANDLYWALDVLRHDKRIPKNNEQLEVWFASHQNRVFHEIIGKKTNVIKEYLEKNYYDITANYVSAMPCKVVTPILGFEPLKYFIESELEVPHKGLRAKIAKKLNPELGSLPRVRIPTGQRIPSKYLSRIEEDFRCSWYAKNVCPDIEVFPYLKHDAFWFRWAAASVVNYFISNGINVK